MDQFLLEEERIFLAACRGSLYRLIKCLSNYIMVMRERGVEVGGRSGSNIAVYKVRVIHLRFVCMLCHTCVCECLCVVGEHSFPPHPTCKYSVSALTIKHLRQHYSLFSPDWIEILRRRRREIGKGMLKKKQRKWRQPPTLCIDTRKKEK